jgi:hypothetical protein
MSNCLAWRIQLFLMSLPFLGACSVSSSYTGDGRLIDNGSSAANERYVVELGQLDLGRAGSTTFRLGGLPAVSFVAGVQVPAGSDPGGTRTLEGTTADVSLELMDASGNRVFSVAGPLRDWVWSSPMRGGPSFVYRRPPSGSFFVASLGSTYKLQATVRAPDPTIPAGTLVVLKSGGWK